MSISYSSKKAVKSLELAAKLSEVTVVKLTAILYLHVSI